MFELRILAKKVPCLKGIGGFFNYKVIDSETIMDTLQYRTYTHNKVADGVGEWSDWKDVPRVEDDT